VTCSFAFGLVESNLWNKEQLQALKVTVKQLATSAVTWLNNKQAMQLLGQDYTSFTRRARVLMEAGYKKFSSMIQQVRMHVSNLNACIDHQATRLQGCGVHLCIIFTDQTIAPGLQLSSVCDAVLSSHFCW
jgi:hypothetical protein